MSHNQNHSHHNSDSELKEYWDKENPILEEIYNVGMKEYAKRVSDIEKAFVLKDRNLRCIDERTPGGLHLAGAGILLDLDKEELEKVKEELKENNIEGVCSHAGCGAAKLYADLSGQDMSRADELARWWAKELAGILNVPYKGHIGEVGQEEMRKPLRFHNARVIYLDGIGKFDYSLAEGLPAGFIINCNLSMNNALKEAKIAASIATGDHGFGNMITKESPLLVIAIGNNEKSELSLNKIKGEAEKLIANLIEENPEMYKDRLKADGFAGKA